MVNKPDVYIEPIPFYLQVSLSHQEAFEGIYNGEYWGVIAFGKNFTSYLIKR